jgi:hypothetical protein
MNSWNVFFEIKNKKFVCFCRTKDNVKNAGGARLNSNFECFTIGFFSKDGKRSMEHFNFGPEECKNNVVTFPGVTIKLKHHGDNKVVNIYQKPRKLLDWMINHFSHVGDWVLDLCSGSGTGLASALALGRPCVAVEKDGRQTLVLRSRVLKLVDDLMGEGEIKGNTGDASDDEEEDIEDRGDGGATEGVDGDNTSVP